MRMQLLVAAVVCLSACALESGESSAGLGGTGGTGGLDAEQRVCVMSVPNAVPEILGPQCAACVCMNEADRPAVEACDQDCWLLLICAAHCDSNSPDFISCVSSLCSDHLGSFNAATTVRPTLIACGSECQPGLRQ